MTRRSPPRPPCSPRSWPARPGPGSQCCAGSSAPGPAPRRHPAARAPATTPRPACTSPRRSDLRPDPRPAHPRAGRRSPRVPARAVPARLPVATPADRANYLALLATPILRPLHPVADPVRGRSTRPCPPPARPSSPAASGMLYGQRVLPWTDTEERTAQVHHGRARPTRSAWWCSTTSPRAPSSTPPSWPGWSPNATWTDRQLGHQRRTVATPTTGCGWPPATTSSRRRHGLPHRAGCASTPTCPAPRPRQPGSASRTSTLDHRPGQPGHRPAAPARPGPRLDPRRRHPPPPACRDAAVHPLGPSTSAGSSPTTASPGSSPTPKTARDLDDDQAEWRAFLLQWTQVMPKVHVPGAGLSAPPRRRRRAPKKR